MSNRTFDYLIKAPRNSLNDLVYNKLVWTYSDEDHNEGLSPSLNWWTKHHESLFLLLHKINFRPQAH